MRCKWLPVSFAILYGLALLVYATASALWAGSLADSLSGLFLTLLGLPWILLLPDGDSPWLLGLAVLAPLLNLACLVLLCRWLGRRARRAASLS